MCVFVCVCVCVCVCVSRAFLQFPGAISVMEVVMKPPVKVEHWSRWTREQGYGPIREQGYGPIREQGYDPIREQGCDLIREQGYGLMN